MNTPNQDPEHPDNMDLLKKQASECGPGCCCSTAPTGKTGFVIGAIVLVAAGVMVVRAITTSSAPTKTAAPTFAALTAGQAADASGTNSAAAAAGDTTVGTSLGTLTDLNTAAGSSDAVFVFLPGKDGTSVKSPSTATKGAARLIESKAGLKCGLFTLKADSIDYDEIARQVSLPGVLALVKGRGMSVISGDITEAKLVQGFVSASSAGGCAGGSCAPGAPGCP